MLRRLSLRREVISEWSEYESLSERTLAFYDAIFRFRTRFAIVAIFILTFQHSFGYAFTSLIPNAEQAMDKGTIVVPALIIIWRLATIPQIRRHLSFRDPGQAAESIMELATIPVIIAAISYFYVWGTAEAFSWLYDRADKAGGAWMLLLAVCMIIPFLIAMAFLLLPYFSFFVRQAHPMLEPITVMTLAWVLAEPQLVGTDGGSIPADTNQLIAFCGAASVSAICMAEFITLYWLGLRLDYIPSERDREATVDTSADGSAEADAGYAHIRDELHSTPRIHRTGSSRYLVPIVVLAAAVATVLVTAHITNREILASASARAWSSEVSRSVPYAHSPRIPAGYAGA